MFSGNLTMIIIIGAVVLLAAFLVGTYNNLITRKNRVKNAWSQIEVQLKRRFDLIPNLVETVKGYAAHEKTTFENVAEARSRYQSAGDPAAAIAANNQMTAALGKLFAIAEAYPELKANTNFLDLQNELSEIEEKISYSRMFYNDTVLLYNNSIQVFPANIVAGMFRFEEAAFFQVEEEARTAPKVSF